MRRRRVDESPADDLLTVPLAPVERQLAEFEEVPGPHVHAPPPLIHTIG